MFKGKTKIYKILCLRYILNCCNDMQTDQGSHIQPGPKVKKKFMLNSAEHEIYPAYKC